MSGFETVQGDDKYLLTFQDETQLWISKEFIEKYPQLPFYDIIEHSEKYDDGSYYIDIPSYPMNKVIQFLMEDNVDISSLNVKESYDIYKTLTEYSVKIDNEIQSDLLLHVKELFKKYLKDNNYTICGWYGEDNELTLLMELFSSDGKEMYIKGLITPKQKNELLYYSLLIRMMSITRVKITYNYSSNISLEYICPKCIKDIFPSLEELEIDVISNYKKTELLLNPNSDDYIMEYIRLFNNNDYEIKSPDEYEYYNESEMNEYNKISSSLDRNKLYYSRDLIDTVAERRDKNELPKLYKYVVNEAIYTNDYSQIDINKTENEYTLDDKVRIKYDVSSKLGISQLLFLPSYLFISKVILARLKEITNQIDLNLLSKLMTTHVFPNVTELIYDDNDEPFQLSLIKKECFPKLNIINYDMRINDLAYNFPHLKELLAKNLISIDYLSLDSSRSANIDLFESIENNKQNIDCLYIEFRDDKDNEDDVRNSLERFLKSDILQYLNKLFVIFDYRSISIEYLTWISTLFNGNKFNTIHKLEIMLLINEDSSSEYLTIYENIMKILIPKASIVTIKCCTMSFINRLIPKGYFHNTTELFLGISDIPDDNFFKLYTTDNFPQLKTINFCKYDDNEWLISIIKTFCEYMNNNNFPSSCNLILSKSFFYNDEYIYDPSTSVFRCKYDTHLFMDSIIGINGKMMSKYEIETLFDFDDEQLSKLTKCITTGNFPQLKEFSLCLYSDISSEQVNICKQQLKDSSFIQENHVHYKLY
ncbi:hypothetical protein WA158_004033 [Blastocystis sp. Blastoise]